MQQVLALLLFALMPIAGMADGKVFPPIALPANVTIPDQRALIHFTNDTERLVIETRFTGSGTNFAWVVPLPGPPAVEAATPGLFPTLQHLFQPRIIHRVTRYYLAILAFLAFGYILAFVRPTKRLSWLDVLACAVIGACAGLHTGEPAGMGVFVVVFIALMLSVIAVRVGSRSAVVGFWILFLMSVLAIVLYLPALSTAGTKGMSSTATTGPGVSILDRRLVGVFETTTISSRDSQALQIWLRENGFAISTNSEPVIASYVKDGWVFVAAKVRRDSADRETSTPHPLSFTFKTDKPVYPLRLTGVDNGPLEVELYVFGPARAKAAHFKVKRCARPNYPPRPSPDSWRWSRGVAETPNIVHPLLRGWVEGAPVVTRLSATLSPADMRQDAWIEWQPFAERKHVLFSRTGASSLALNWASALFTLCLIGLGALATVSEGVKARAAKCIVIAAVASIGLAGAVYLVLPKTDVRLVRRLGHEAFHNLYFLSDWLSGTTPATLPDMRANFQRLLAHSSNSADWLRYVPNGFERMNNDLLGGQVREEDSPGNFVLREKDGLLIFYGFDAEGAQHGINTWNLSK
jgi:hypothetical protein